MLKNKLAVGTGLLTLLLAVVITSCAAPGAAKLEARVGVVEDNFNKLETVVDNKVDAETIEELRQQLLEVSNTVNNSGVIKYSGAGWVAVGSGLMAIIFLVFIGLFVKYYLKANTNTSLLELVTTALKNADPETQRRVKGQIESQTSNGGFFTEKHKDMLAKFTKTNGTFIEKVIKSIV